jgi:ABC-type phosphate transport system permease subunit
VTQSSLLKIGHIRDINRMEKATTLTQKHTSAGDAAVSGLFGGLLAGAMMAVFLALAGLLAGLGAGTYLSYFASGENVSPVQGLLTHLAVSGVYGLVFGLGWRFAKGKRFSRVPGWMGGLAFGILLWVLALAVILPGTSSPLRLLPPLLLAAAHVIYGITLGALVRGK